MIATLQMTLKQHKQLLNLLDQAIDRRGYMGASKEYWESKEGRREKRNFAGLKRARKYIAETGPLQ